MEGSGGNRRLLANTPAITSVAVEHEAMEQR